MQRGDFRQRRRHGIGIAFEHAVREELDDVGANEGIVRVLRANSAGLPHHSVVVDRAACVAVLLWVIPLRERRTYRELAASLQPVVHQFRCDRSIQHPGDPDTIEALRDALRRLHHLWQVHEQQESRIHDVARFLVGGAVRFAVRVDPDQLGNGGEIGSERRARKADALPFGILRASERHTIESPMVPVVAEELDRVLGGGEIERRAQGRVRAVGPIVVGEVPLPDVHPLAGRSLVALDAAAHEDRELSEGLRLAVEVADVEIDDAARMDVRVDDTGQHQPAVQAFDLCGRSDQFGRAALAADVYEPAAAHGKRLGVAMVGRGRVDACLRDDQVGRRIGQGARCRKQRRAQQDDRSVSAHVGSVPQALVMAPANRGADTKLNI